MKKKSVYIASPYTIGDQLKNTQRQIFVAEILASHGLFPFWPLSSHYWHELFPHGHEFWMHQDYYWIEQCDCLLRLDGESSGADREVIHAEERGIPVFYNIDELLDWAINHD